MTYYPKKDRIVEELEYETETEGYVPGTREYDTVLRDKKMDRCRFIKGLSSCAQCIAQEACSLMQEKLREVAVIQYTRFPVPK